MVSRVNLALLECGAKIAIAIYVPSQAVRCGQVAVAQGTKRSDMCAEVEIDPIIHLLERMQVRDN